MLKQKTVYFREEDLPLWEKIENKAEWLHERLNTKRVQIGDKTVVLNGKAPLKMEVNAPVLPVEVASHVVKSIPKPSGKTCKNGHPLDDRGRCFGKSCKYA